MFLQAKPWRRQPPDGTPLNGPWREISYRVQHGAVTVEGSISREPTIDGMAYAGNGSTKGLYVSLLQGVTCSASNGSVAIATIFLGSTATSGVLAALGVSANSLGGYMYIARNTGGALTLGIDDAANSSGLLTTTTATYNDRNINCAVGLLTTDASGVRFQSLFVNGVLVASGSTAGFGATTYDRASVGLLRRQASSGYASDKVLAAAFARQGASEEECRDLSARSWSALYKPRMAWVPRALPATGVAGPLVGHRHLIGGQAVGGRLVA